MIHETKERGRKIRVAVFASGNGSNAERLSEYFMEHDQIDISLIYCNNAKTYVLDRAKRLNIPTCLFNRPTFYESTDILDVLKRHKID